MPMVCFNCRAPAPLVLNTPCACGSTTWAGTFGTQLPLPDPNEQRLKVIHEVAAWIEKQADAYLIMAKSLPPEDALLAGNLADTYRLAAADVRRLDPAVEASEAASLDATKRHLHSIFPKPTDA